jgi:hypothetical protein
MASPAAEHRQSDPPPHGSARPDRCGHGAYPGHTEPRQRSSWGQEGAEHGDGAEAKRLEVAVNWRRKFNLNKAHRALSG